MDFFNLTVEDFDKPEQKKSWNSEDLYKPSPKNAKGNTGVYKAVLRFLPNPVDPKNKSILSKWSVFLTNPDTQQKRSVDCPSTIGEKSIIQDVFFKLKKSNSVADQELSKEFSRTQKFTSLVLIVEDKNNPDLEGKIMVWQYGVKVHDKIKALIKPEFGKPCIPFDLFEAKDFFLSVKTVNKFPNYDDSYFLEERTPLTLNGITCDKDNQTSTKKVIEYLKENAPDLSTYDYQPWTDEIRNFVNDCIKAIVPAGRVASEVAKYSQESRSASASASKVEEKVEVKPTKKVEIPEIPIKSADLTEDDMKFDDMDLDGDFDEELYNSL